jgi:hypothetical protein
MGFTDAFLTDVGSQIAADDEVLAEARTRLALVREIARTFPGALRTYGSGSLIHHTFNDPVTDGDGGVVLDRRCYPSLGPDGGGETPTDIAGDLCALLGPAVRETYPAARCGSSKRGPKIYFGASMAGQDPTVDMVVALTRRDAPGLWIPNLKKGRWEASDPEQHAELINGGTVALRRTRRRVIRLLKAWNKQWNSPGLSSFHLSVLALQDVMPGVNAAMALHTVFGEAAEFLATGHNTPDPAGVSAPLKLLESRSVVVDRLQKAAGNLADALEHDDDQQAVQAAMHRVFRDFVDAPAGDALARAASRLRGNRAVTTASLGLGGAAVVIPATRAFGGRPQG